MGNKNAVIPETAPLCPIYFPNCDNLFHLVCSINSRHRKENSMATWLVTIFPFCGSKLKSCIFILSHL